jgi:predicted ATPase
LEQYWLALQVEAYQRLEQFEEAQSVLTEALAVAEKNGERFWEADLHRLKGELTLQKLSAISPQLSVPGTQHLTPSTQAEVELKAAEYFLKAIEISQKQHAKSLELRASTSLARLWQQQGKTKQAQKLLSKIYNWFTEGFDTKDLQEAKAMLEVLT